MPRDEKGFVLPLALLLSLLIFFVVHQQLQVYVAEALFSKSVSDYYEMENLLELALVDAPRSFGEEDVPGERETQLYPQGEVTYILRSVQDGWMTIEIHCQLSSDRQHKVLAEIERESGKMIKWKKL
ncbi:competence type IV pilus minor pilin ComGG [Bacillus songklensis]|uniref:competence type IV pilus minor pilin ComGG n=1 Tax=Bacillus songklensis TaxID=1069116 RepID=UPI00366FFB1C